MQKDNLFDGKFTFLDAVKIALLIVTGFSTWNVVGIMTPDGPWAWVRQLAALIVVEGAFVGFEYATADAKSRRQVRWATIGFFCSLTVISLFAGLSGLLEFGGLTLMTQHAGDWLGLSWSVGDAVQASSLLTLVLWIAVLASIYRIYTLNDPGKRAELEGIEIGEQVTTEANAARRLANRDVAPVVAGHRAIAEIRKRYSGEMSAEQMQTLLNDVAESLKKNYAVRPDTGFIPQEDVVQSKNILDRALGLLRPASPAVDASHEVAVDPELGFVKRIPPMEKTVHHTSALGAYTPTVATNDETYHPVSYQPAKQEVDAFPEPADIPFKFKAAVDMGGIEAGVRVLAGTEVIAVLYSDGKYNLSEPAATYAFARVSPEELHYYQTGEEMPTADNFRQS